MDPLGAWHLAAAPAGVCGCEISLMGVVMIGCS
jgi:hypothetical protein